MDEKTCVDKLKTCKLSECFFKYVSKKVVKFSIGHHLKFKTNYQCPQVVESAKFFPDLFTRDLSVDRTVEYLVDEGHLEMSVYT
jgi:hypothetical protein